MSLGLAGTSPIHACYRLVLTRFLAAEDIRRNAIRTGDVEIIQAPDVLLHAFLHANSLFKSVLILRNKSNHELPNGNHHNNYCIFK